MNDKEMLDREINEVIDILELFTCAKASKIREQIRSYFRLNIRKIEQIIKMNASKLLVERLFRKMSQYTRTRADKEKAQIICMIVNECLEEMENKMRSSEINKDRGFTR